MATHADETIADSAEDSPSTQSHAVKRPAPDSARVAKKAKTTYATGAVLSKAPHTASDVGPICTSCHRMRCPTDGVHVTIEEHSRGDLVIRPVCDNCAKGTTTLLAWPLDTMKDYGAFLAHADSRSKAATTTMIRHLKCEECYERTLVVESAWCPGDPDDPDDPDEYVDWCEPPHVFVPMCFYHCAVDGKDEEVDKIRALSSDIPIESGYKHHVYGLMP